MQQRKSKILIFYIFLLLFLGSLNNVKLNPLKLKEIDKIKVSGLDDIDNKIILKSLKKLNLTNIFFINEVAIKKIINSNSLVENYKVFKKYPSELNIEINKTKFLANINKNGKLYLIGSNGKYLDNNYSVENIPFIFGNPKISQFLSFKSIIDQSPILYSEVKNLYFFQSNRWDIKFRNNILIKLPETSVSKALKDVSDFLFEHNLKNIKIIDMRVKNQIIVNE